MFRSAVRPRGRILPLGRVHHFRSPAFLFVSLTLILVPKIDRRSGLRKLAFSVFRGTILPGKVFESHDTRPLSGAQRVL